MRIAFLGCKGVPASMAHGGGIESHVEHLAPRLADRGHEITIYVRAYTNPRKRRTWKGCRLVTLPTIRTKNLETIVHVFLSTLHVIGRGYHVIHYHGVGPSTLAWIPRIFCPRAKVVVTFHSRDRFHEKWNVFARAYLAWGEWTAVRFPHATIAVSHVIQTFCRRLFHESVYFIPNGVEIPSGNIGTSEIEKLGLRPNGYFLGLGRLVPHKAFDVALEAYFSVPTATEFVIAGDAGYDLRYAEELYALAERDRRVRLLGWQEGAALKQIIAHCYALIHPSRSEGLSIAVLEAMANGKVVIMSDIPENLELIDHSGVSFPVDDVDELRKTLERISVEEDLVKERGERGRDFVSRNFCWESVADKTELVYRAVTGQGVS
jgi:glycosyltransferase involved in cell wall biosynthesis